MDSSTLLSEETAPSVPQGNPDTLTEADQVRLNAAQKLGSQGNELGAAVSALSQLIAENPENAPSIIERINRENPKLAQRLAQKKLPETVDPAVTAAFEALSAKVETLEKKQGDQDQTQAKQTYRNWRPAELDPANEDPQAKALQATFAQVLDGNFADRPITEDLLEDALAIAKRRANYQEPTVRKALDKQASQFAQKARMGQAASVSSVVTDASPAADPSIASQFGRTDQESLQKVADAKRKAGFR